MAGWGFGSRKAERLDAQPRAAIDWRATPCPELKDRKVECSSNSWWHGKGTPVPKGILYNDKNSHDSKALRKLHHLMIWKGSRVPKGILYKDKNSHGSKALRKLHQILSRRKAQMGSKF
jgi:hypothetical protein